MTKSKFMVAGAFTALALCVSCVDSSYDLDDVDMTLGIGQEGSVLWLPNCSTDSILLRNIMKTNDVVRMVWDESQKDSIYCVKCSGFNNFEISGAVTGTITVYNATHKYIQMGDMPDFLNESEVVLDLENPIVYLEADNQSICDVDVDISVESFKEGQLVKRIQTSSLTANKNSQTNYYLAQEHDDSSTNPYSAYTYKKVEGMSDAFWKKGENIGIPDELRVSIDRVSFTATAMDFTRSALNLNYGLYAPMNFGENFHIIYTSQETGLSDDLEDVNVDAKSLRLEGICTNSMPLDVTVSISPIDQNGNVINGLEVTKSVSVKSNEESAISFTVKPKAGHTIMEYLKGTNGITLDGIEYRAEGKANGNKDVLTRSTHLTLKNVRIGIEGVVVDAN